MGQRDVLKFLQDMRAMSPKFWTVKEVQSGLKARGHGNGAIRGVSDDLFKLACFGQVEWRGKGIWHHQKLFRGREQSEDSR